MVSIKFYPSWIGSSYRTSLVLFLIIFWFTCCLAVRVETGSVFVRCNGNQTHDCGHNQCISISLLCDDVSQCPDGSDEVNCKGACRPPHWFRCHNQHCISSQWRCDGENDCMDWSDETDCESAQGRTAAMSLLSTCREDQFKCKDGRCINSHWTCDRQRDCTDGDDEDKELCKGRTCLKETQFTCDDGECVSNSWKCDGVPDCDDGSDEAPSLCGDGENKNSSVSCDTTHGGFLCKDGSACIPAAKVCDTNQDCQDKSDEEAYCSTTNSCSSHGCEQGCLQKESGPSCYCNDGFILAINQKNCQDIDECSQFGICSQRCINTQGSYQCSCFPGYTNFNGSCLATSGETLLLFSTKTEVRGVDLTNNRYFSVAKSLPHVIGVAYDGKEKRVYWTDVQAGRETIVSSQLDGSKMKTLVTSGLDMPEDLVVDEVNRNIYFTDSIAKQIGVCSLRDPISCAVLETDVEQPRAIVVHHDMMQVLFTDWGSSKKCIGVLGMDGTNRRNLVTERLEWPNGLALDDALDRVFWADAKLDIVESIRLDGTDRRIVLDSIVKHPFSLAVFEDRLYWSDRENKDVVSCNKFTGKNLITHVKEFGVQPYGINVFNPVMVKNLTSPCRPINPCSHLCLPAMKSYICRCPAHLKLNSDKKTCSVSTDATTFLIATSRSLYQAYPQSVGKDEFTVVATLDDGVVGNLAGNSLDNTVMVLTKKLHGVNVIGILDRNNKKVINILSSSFAGSIAFDPRSKTVFWTDFKKMSVMAQSLVKQEPVEIASDLDTPLSLLVVPKHNRLLVGELGRLSLLKLGPQKSSDRQVISTALNRPTCLAYDPSLDTVFIGDAGSRIIFRWDWGKSNLVPFKQNIGEVIDIAIKDNLLYWVEKGKDILFWTSSTTNTKEVSWMSLSTIAGVRDHLRISLSGNNSGADYNTGCLESPCSHLCIPGEGVNDFTCSCPFGMVLNKDEHSCRQDCPGDVFSCGDGQCIHQSWKCDGVADCKNKADEVNCTAKSVAICDNSTQVTCDNGECLPKDWWCDGDNDCTDGSDENAACPAIECDKGKFQCKDGKQCVVDRWRCDGDFDCRDESDETECGAVSCLATQFACKDGLKCLQHSWICDGTADCHDGSDEINCTLSINDPKCSSTEFRCSNGDCIDLVLVCDGQQDCWDEGDESEQICHNREETEVLVDDVNCSGGFKCDVHCMSPLVRCNGTSECWDGSDEADCPMCTKDTFRCNSGERCVPRSWQCDHVNDCSDGSDEIDCIGFGRFSGMLSRGLSILADKFTRKNTCNSTTHFQCLSGECLDLNRVCDWREDCSDGSDEDRESCSSSCSPSPCGSGQSCLPTPRGPICQCITGYTRSNPEECTDYDECQLLQSCSQYCTNTKGSFKCDCEEGFVAEHSLCRPEGDPPKFLYAVGSTIKAAIEGNLGTHDIHKELSTHARPISNFVYNIHTDEFFWSSPGLGMIGRKNSSSAGNEIWMSNLLKPDQLALDWREANLYFSSQVNSIVTVCGIMTKLCVKLPPIGHDAITKLAVDPRSAKLFVGGYTRKRGRYPSAAIYSLDMDGKEAPKAIALGKIGMVSGLAVDPVKKLVFWSDVTSRALGVCSYLGTDRKVVTLSSQPRPAGLVLFGSKLFWTTHGSSWLHSHQIIFNSTVERTLSLPLNSHSMMFSHPSLEPLSRYSSLCTSLNCSQLCLLSSPTTATCVCSSGFQGTDNTSKICLSNTSSNLSLSDQADGPSVIPLKNDRGLETAIIVILVIIIILIVALCFIFVQCRRTKRGPEIGIRFSSLAFGVGHSAANSNDWEQDQQHVTVDKTGTGVGFSNPRFQSGASQNFQWKNSEVWPDSPDIDRDSPAILGGHSTPLVAMRDTDSAFQEPSLASSYDEDENQHLSVTSYKDKHRLLD